MEENGLIRRLRLVSKFMTSSTGKYTILPNISRSKDNQTMKFGQLIEYNVGNYAENETGRLVPGIFSLFLKKALCKEKKYLALF